VLHNRRFVLLFASGWLWHTTRWGSLFLGSYVVSTMTDTPVLNQLVGACVFAPMLLGGLVAGALSDRFDRRRLVMAAQLAFVPVGVAMTVAAQAGWLHVWMVFPLTLTIGLGRVVNMTALRPLMYDVAGPELAPRALALDSAGVASSSVAGALMGGAVVDSVGIGAAFGALAALMAGSTILLWKARPTSAEPEPVPATAVPVKWRFEEQVQTSLALLRRTPRLASLLGVTVVVNLFYFSFLPLIPVVAEGFTTSALLAGVMGAAAGCGQLFGGLALAWHDSDRHGLVYVGGSAICLTGLCLFALAPVVSAACVALLFAGTGQAGFASMQSLLAIESASESERGAALGLLSTAIGALPIGMVLVGVVSQLVGPRTTLLASAVAGMTALTFCACRPSAASLFAPAD
jgi:predicted MFS family arabinose efflux permease